MPHSPGEFKAALRARRLTQRRLAELLGVSDRTVGRWAAEGVPDGAHELGRLEQILGLGDHRDTNVDDPLTTLLDQAAATGQTRRLIDWAIRQAHELELLGELGRRFAALKYSPEQGNDPLAHVPDQVQWSTDVLPRGHPREDPGHQTAHNPASRA